VRLVLSLAAATLPIVTILATPKRSGTLPVEIQLALEPHIAHLCLVVSELPADMTKEVLGLKLATRCQIMPSHHLSAWFQSGNTETVAPDDLSELSKARLRIVSYSSRPVRSHLLGLPKDSFHEILNACKIYMYIYV
jgi:hypothetical protein